MPLESHLHSLITKALQGDKRAYAKFLKDICPLLRKIIAPRVNIATDIEDIVQEILLSIHKALPTYDPKRAVIPWLTAIVKFRLTDYLRKLYRRSEHQADISYEEIEQTYSNKEDKPVTASDKRSEYIEEGLKALPEKQQEIMKLIHIEGYTSKEVAATLNMTTSAVKVTAHRIYKRLRTEIEQKEQYD